MTNDRTLISEDTAHKEGGDVMDSSAEYKKKVGVRILGLSLVLVAYLLAVFWFAFSVTQRRIEQVIPDVQVIRVGVCDYLGKYLVRQGPAGEGTAWLFQDYLTLMFDKSILSDPVCFGKLMSDLAITMRERHYDNKVVIRIFDVESKALLQRFEIEP